MCTQARMKGSSTAQLIFMSVIAHEGAAASHGARSLASETAANHVTNPQSGHRETTRGPRAAARLFFFTLVADSSPYSSARPGLCPGGPAYVAGVLLVRAHGTLTPGGQSGLTTRAPALHGCRCSRRITQRLATSVSKSAVAQIPLSFHSYFTPPDPSSSTQPPSCVNTPEPSMYSSSGFNSLHRARDSPTMF